MKVAIRESMVPGETLGERLGWLESVGIDGIELHLSSLELPVEELRRVVSQSRVSVSAIEGATTLLHADPATREAATATIRERLALAGEFGAVGVLVVPQFGRQPAFPDLSPWKSGADLERGLLVTQLTELAPAARAAGVRLFLE
ncbi:MAG: TIM barrel protein, partial [Chloroflexia bacterium]|nr:TIM barrel protein [Chloroflexia bacterium]